MNVKRFFKLADPKEQLIRDLKGALNCSLGGLHIQHEICYHVEMGKDISDDCMARILGLLRDPLCEKPVTDVTGIPLFGVSDPNKYRVEYGPRLNFSTPFSTNALSILKSAGLGDQVTRFECSRIYLLVALKSIDRQIVDKLLHDHMTETKYTQPIETFELKPVEWKVYEVDIMGEGQKALVKVNQEMGLAMDAWDVEYYSKMFQEMGRNPTIVECFDLAQSNSEHSRHWFFSGRMVVDGEEHPQSLFSMVKSTQTASNQNSKIKFSDNSSCIEGHPDMPILSPESPDKPSKMIRLQQSRDIILTAETHNFPTGVAPFPGATTGTGGRIRDVQSTGRGANVVAGTAGYCFGNLNLPDYPLPWEEDSSQVYPPNFASPLNVIIQGSNGASDYGNKFGEPVIAGFSRSFGLMVAGVRTEWIKPIMFSGGLGSLDSRFTNKFPPMKDDAVVKVGGPVYRIGVGGGAASSMSVQGNDERHQLDLGAVQRGDAEMEQKMNRVIRSCIENHDNPIRSIHDQGAGGNGNVLKEISEPNGAVIYADKFSLGDKSVNLLELWVAEYQESNALLVSPDHEEFIKRVAEREKCPLDIVGKITDSKKIELRTSSGCESTDIQQLPVNLDLGQVLGAMPRKVFNLDRIVPVLPALSLPDGLKIEEALSRVLRLPSVASKRFLTNKVDRSVTGLIARQQCVGPFHTPLADVAVTALSYWSTKGAATSIGEQPIKCLVSPSAGARMSVGESLTNLVFAPISNLKDVKCSANWMWPAKLPGEGARMFDACRAMCSVMSKLGIAVDGGKDSLSMAARVGDDIVKSPGAVVISCYAACPDITKVVTPNLKCPQGQGVLVYINLSKGQKSQRLGGSALAQTFSQLGETTPDLDDARLFSRGFNALQSLIQDGAVRSGHDVSDGGLITAVLEMAFAGNCGLDLTLTAYHRETASRSQSALEALFHEELGFVLEVDESHLSHVGSVFDKYEVAYDLIGRSQKHEEAVSIELRWAASDVTELVYTGSMKDLRDIWEETSFQLEFKQTSPQCVFQEKEGLKYRKEPKFHLSFPLSDLPLISSPNCESEIKVAVIREEGSNGDREMAAAFISAGFQVHDVTMSDLIKGRCTLDMFRGIAFVGGFSYADVFGSAKGWAASIFYNLDVKSQFDKFYSRDDTFSLGVCNGCQLMTLLGWLGKTPTSEDSLNEKIDKDNQAQLSADADFMKLSDVILTHNDSARYESRFTTVQITESPSIMLDGMAGSTLGIWVAHGEGKMVFRDDECLSYLDAKQLIPLRYVDDDNEPSQLYPFNPNGSPGASAALCSENGRHLAMMPHPERSFLGWQWPWAPENMENMQQSPWMKLFHNAFSWCFNTQRV